MTESVTRLNVLAVFDHPSAAQDAASKLTGLGLAKESVLVLPSESDERVRFERAQDPDLLYRGFVDPAKGAAVGFLVGSLTLGLLGLLLGSGWLYLMGMGPAMAAGAFWSTAIGVVIGGLAGLFAGYTLNSPLMQPEPPHGPHEHGSGPTILSVNTSSADLERTTSALSDTAAKRVSVWGASNGDWRPTTAS